MAKKRKKKKAETIGEQLKRFIEDSGLSNYEIEKRTGIARIAISRFLSGEREDIRLTTVNRLCEVLGLELREK